MKFNHAWAFSSPRHFGYGIVIAQRDTNAHTSWVLGNALALESVPDSEAAHRDITADAIMLTEEAAQKLLDDLWNAGLRPRYGRKEDELLSAVTDARDDARQTRDALLSHLLDL